MTLKDWLLLLVPIIFNGIIIFIAQFILNRKFKRIEKSDNRRNDIIEEFLDMLFDSLEVVSEVESRFRFREDMCEINEKFKISISELSRYGKNMELILNISDELEKIRAISGYCLAKLTQYQKLGESRSSTYPMDEQDAILNYLIEIRSLLKKQHKKCIRK